MRVVDWARGTNEGAPIAENDKGPLLSERRRKPWGSGEDATRWRECCNEPAYGAHLSVARPLLSPPLLLRCLHSDVWTDRQAHHSLFPPTRWHFHQTTNDPNRQNNSANNHALPPTSPPLLNTAVPSSPRNPGIQVHQTVRGPIQSAPLSPSVLSNNRHVVPTSPDAGGERGRNLHVYLPGYVSTTQTPLGTPLAAHEQSPPPWRTTGRRGSLHFCLRQQPSQLHT
ncbi:hypothetical protein BC567DRAFT_63765 [Phyllosticta citribraziliensis]